MKVCLKILPALCVLAGILLLSSPACAATEGDWSYSYTEGGAVINQYNGSDTDLVIPSEIGGQPVVALREQLFYLDPEEYPDGAPFTSVVVPAGVTTVGDAAFYKCASLRTVTFQSTSALTLGEGAFTYCSSLETVHFTGSASVAVGDNAFYGCTPLTTFDAASVTSVGEMAFMDCASLQSVSLASGASVGMQAFINCSALSGIGSAPVVIAGDNPFSYCSSLESVTLSVPSSGLTLGNVFFKNCSSLQTVVFAGDGDVSVGINCFNGCTSLVSVSGTGIVSVGAQAFYDLAALETVILADGADVGQAAFMKCTALENLGSGTISSLGSYAFAQCPALTGVSLSVSEIGEFSFYGCSQLYSFTCTPLSSVGNSAFSGCTLLNGITLADGASVGGYAFNGCSSLTGTGSGAIASLGESAFNDCSLLEKVAVSSADIPETCFYNCTSLAKVTLTGTQNIGGHAFMNCKALSGLSLPSTLKTIGLAAFSDCSGLLTAAVPSGVAAIGSGAFYGCSSLSSVTLLEPLASIGEQAFGNCASLGELDIPDTVTDIGNDAFTRSTVLIVGEGSAALAYAGSSGYTSRIRGSSALVEVGLDAETAEEKVKRIVEYYITDDMSDYDKALILHDYLITFADYDTGSEYKHTAEGVLLHGGGVCQSYTLAYQMLLNAAGITNDTETGDDHIWNMVMLNGNWYHIDCTWDDPVGGGHENHDFFCVTDYVLDGFDSHERYNGTHQASCLDMNYFFLTGSLNSRISAISSLAADLISGGESSGTITSDPFGGKYHIAADRLAVEYWQGKTVTDAAGENRFVCRLAYTSTPMTDTSAVNDFAVTLTLVPITDLGDISVDPGRAFALGVGAGADFEVTAEPSGIVTADKNGVLTAAAAGTARLTLTGNEHIYILDIRVSALNTFNLPSSLTTLEADFLNGVPVQALIIPEGIASLDEAALNGLDSLCLLILEGSTALPDSLPDGILVLYPLNAAPSDPGSLWGYSID